ncbi:MAG: hypothetical protein LH606_22090 [Cytophagaceae bacterium]|nr:hypothetical protein [Cytophagaceae bacterium]
MKQLTSRQNVNVTKVFLSLSLSVLISLAGLGQSTRTAPTKKVVKPTAKPTKTAVAPKPVAPKVNFNVLPLFGEAPRTASQQAQDAVFLQSCEQNFGSREDASRFFSERAWEYLTEGALDTATYRFNLAHLLNSQNVDTYWGLGVVQYNKGNRVVAINLLNRRLAIHSSNATLMTDLATLHLNNFSSDSLSNDLSRAMTLLDRAVSLDTANANAFMKLSLAEFHQQHYDQAWQHFHHARALDVKNLDFNFLTQLMARKEDPRGVFKQQN